MKLLICWAFLCLFQFNIWGEKLQILHTNDLHGYLENTVSDPKRGGYDRIKSIIQKYKSEASERGIDSLVLDAGDFMEGNLFYLAGKGQYVWNALNMIGYDAVVIGNHDYLMGSHKLDKLIGKFPPKFSYLGSNFKISSPLILPHLTKHMKKDVIFEKAGVKIGILGLTTNEIFYTWAFLNGKIKSPKKVAKKTAKRLKSLGADYVFALTHLGLKQDKEVISKGDRIDLVVGGHSHTPLFKPVYHVNEDDKKIPIVQTGSHGRYVGRLMLELEKGRPLQVISYELIPVNRNRLVDEKLNKYIEKARGDLYKNYTRRWLHEVLGHSEAPLVHGLDRLTPWTAFITDAIKESIDADVSFHSPSFGSSHLPAGEITREKVFQSHPRVFDHKNKEGWFVYRVKALGLFIKRTVKFILSSRLPISFSGITFDIIDTESGQVGIDWERGRFKIENVKINGAPIDPFKRYSLALSEGIVEGALGITGSVRIILKEITKSKISIWRAINNKVKRERVVRAGYGIEKEEKFSKSHFDVDKTYERYPNRFFRSGLKEGRN